MEDIAQRYRRLAEAFNATVDAVPDDRWDSPSPCEEWSARDVVAHVVETQGIFLGLVGRQLGDIPAVDDAPGAAARAAT
ncbi:MAG: maleylpyruvate isomerase N-terminal domain-containing protein, partial [Egibacteraceae bacterium]